MGDNRCNNEYEPEMNVYHGSNCCEHEEKHHHENCCCCCPCPSMPTECCDLCAQQLKFLLSQLLVLYPTQTFVFQMENGTTATGVINSILTNTNRGVVVIDVTVSGVTHQEYINICKIAYFTILETTYNTSIRYLAGPVQPTVCGCVESIDSLISVGDSVEISAAGNTLDTAEVVAVGYCIIALMLGTTIVFVSAKEIEIFLIVSENGG